MFLLTVNYNSKVFYVLSNIFFSIKKLFYQAEVSAEDSYDYFELLKILESEYQQLRELSAGRMVDLVN